VFSAGLGERFYTTAVIGDFTENDARTFLVKEVNNSVADDQQQVNISVSDEEWNTIYKVRFAG
jgi:hypothetical protein